MDNEYYMKKCIELANQAELCREIPVGAILVNEDKIISQSHNLSINNNDPTAHAEINVIQDACKKYKNYRLNGFTLYVTLEPCIMCLGAICEARIGSVIFGAYSNGTKNFNEKFSNLKKEFNLDHSPKFIGGVLGDECALIIKNFFQRKRS
tara:strand:- start:3142 stop:3594 length:453 start_codon:yes stop_codon:yes gene_type:complete